MIASRTIIVAARADNPEMKAMFEEATRGRALVAEWRDAEADGYPVLDVVLRYGRTVDLIVVGQTDREWWGSHYLDVADRVPVEAGRPVLIILKSPSPADSLGKRILVGWNARREAARAVFDALPILRKATEVKVVCVNHNRIKKQRKPYRPLISVRHSRGTASNVKGPRR